ncbi:MAG: HAD hydrolase-like protein [Propionicimonas sp.]
MKEPNMVEVRESLLALWDIDGTLLSPSGGGNADYEEAIIAVFPRAVLGDVHTHGKTDRQVVEEYLVSAGIDVTNAPLVLEQLDVISHKYLTDAGRIPALSGVDHTLARLDRYGIVNGLLTGNTPARAINKLQGSGMATAYLTWGESFFGANAPLRPVMTQRARERYPSRPIVVIGDTPLDGAAAAAAGLHFVGVATGVYDAGELQAAGAIVVVDDLVTGAEVLDATLLRLTG